MKHLKEAVLEPPDSIKLEIIERQELIKKMVGMLYPSILQDEIKELRRVYIEKTGEYDYP